MSDRSLFWLGWITIFLGAIFMLYAASAGAAFAHDHRYAVTPQERSWFNTLKSGKGPCCSTADGTVLKDNDWKSKDGHYSVLINNQWIDVPDEAVLKVPNLYGPTMVWPVYLNNFGGVATVDIRCFMPGVMM